MGIPEATELTAMEEEQEWVQVGKKGKKGMLEPTSNKDISLSNKFGILQDNQGSYKNQESGKDLNTEHDNVRILEQTKKREVLPHHHRIIRRLLAQCPLSPSRQPLIRDLFKPG